MINNNAPGPVICTHSPYGAGNSRDFDIFQSLLKAHVYAEHCWDIFKV